MSTLEKDVPLHRAALRHGDVLLGRSVQPLQVQEVHDIRLVFAPEFDIAFFGGDPDNFTYPRYDLDITFFRVYENDKPAHIDQYLKWSKDGVKDNELIFVSGHPGRPGARRTIAQLEFLRDVDYPSRLETYKRRITLLLNFGNESEENARIAKEELFSYQNSFKAIYGIPGALEGQARSWRASRRTKRRQRRRSRQSQEQGHGKSVARDCRQRKRAARNSIFRLTYIETQPRLQHRAGLLCPLDRPRRGREDEAQRETPARVPRLGAPFAGTGAILHCPDLQIARDGDVWPIHWRRCRRRWARTMPCVKQVLNGKSPADAAQDLIANTKLDDVSVRKQLYEGGAAAVQASTDPLIVLMRNIDPAARELRKQYDDRSMPSRRRAGAQIARTRFAHSGYDQPPDATFTLRLSYGAVKGYEENGKKIPYFTDFGGAYQHAAEHGEQAALPASRKLDEGKIEAEADDAARLCFDGGHHRRQFRQPDRQQEGRGRGHHFRWKHSIAGVELRIRRQAGARRPRGFARNRGGSAPDLRSNQVWWTN